MLTVGSKHTMLSGVMLSGVMLSGVGQLNYLACKDFFPRLLFKTKRSSLNLFHSSKYYYLKADLKLAYTIGMKLE